LLHKKDLGYKNKKYTRTAGEDLIVEKHYICEQSMKAITKYFPELTAEQVMRLQHFQEHIRSWNAKINVISRKDMDSLAVNHILHSLAIAKFIAFTPGTKVLDIGTGGGFPGIPLAIVFPKTHFHLIDSIGKKITVVQSFIHEAGITNAVAEKTRAEEVKDKYDFIVSRAVTSMPKFLPWTKGKIASRQQNKIHNGIIALKGGELTGELEIIGRKYQEEAITQWFEESFFETKKIIYIP